ncbi:hypothetical protein KBD71_03280 [Candidatus Woesebacteria bacterium]|nr:hypothetical protein [Candidatus Woesebacteria bacterium]
MSQEKFPENIERMLEGFAAREVARIEEIRINQGDEAWAQAIGSSIVTQLTLQHIEKTPNDGYLAEQGRRTLLALTPQFALLHSHPTLGHGSSAGMIEELASRGYINLDVNKLIGARWRKDGNRT